MQNPTGPAYSLGREYAGPVSINKHTINRDFVESPRQNSTTRALAVPLHSRFMCHPSLHGIDTFLFGRVILTSASEVTYNCPSLQLSRRMNWCMIYFNSV